jgi:hypothetical protein
VALADGRLKPRPDQEPATLVLVQIKLLDGHGLSLLPIGRFDRAEVFAFATHDDDAPASEDLDAKPTWTASGATLPKLVNVERAGWGLPEQ